MLILILAIDTTAGTSAAVIDEGQLLGFCEFDDPFGHAENIGQAIETALERAKVSASSIKRVAISRGPASYTGLRVGMAAGVSFATARQIPLHGVVCLDAIAAFSTDSGYERWLITADAKRGELFVCSYSGVDKNGLPIRDIAPKVAKPAEVDEEFGDLPRIQRQSNAEIVGVYAERALSAGESLEEVDALYLRSADVTPSAGKKVSG